MAKKELSYKEIRAHAGKEGFTLSSNRSKSELLDELTAKRRAKRRGRT